jgi:hypothetical protein
MIIQRWAAFAAAAALLGALASQAAELPSQRGQTHKAKETQAAKTCNIAGNPGVLAANGICVRLSGYVSSQVSAGQLK